MQKFHQRSSKADKQLKQTGWIENWFLKKSVAFLYSKDEQAEKEIREMTHFTGVTNNITFLGVTLTNQVKDIYDKNFKSLKKKIEEDLRRQNDVPCSLIGRINILKMTILWKTIYTFNAILIKRPTQYFKELEGAISKFNWNNKKNPG